MAQEDNALEAEVESVSIPLTKPHDSMQAAQGGNIGREQKED